MTPRATTVVRGATIVGEARRGRRDIVIQEGRIVAIGSAGSHDVADNIVVDAGGLTVLPGLIDAHVHFQEPGRSGWEGFATGSAACVAGGVTTVVDMPIDSDPPTVDAPAVRAKVAAATQSSLVDVALWGGLVPGNVEHLEELVGAGVVGFKAFACPSGWDDFPEVDEQALAAGMAVAARYDLPVAVHCELTGGGGEESEVGAVRWAAGIAAAEGARLHVVHASAAAAVVEAGRWSGVTTETCPHYLLLDDVAALAIGPRAHCSPPIRSADNREALWEQVEGGHVDLIASDHSPCPPERRSGPTPWAGIDGAGLALPLLHASGRLSLDRLVELMTAAAGLLRLADKGRIAVGADADLVLYDPEPKWTVVEGTSRTRHSASPFVGLPARGRVMATFVRGRCVYSAEQGPAEPGGGRLVRPYPSGPGFRRRGSPSCASRLKE